MPTAGHVPSVILPVLPQSLRLAGGPALWGTVCPQTRTLLPEASAGPPTRPEALPTTVPTTALAPRPLPYQQHPWVRAGSLLDKGLPRGPAGASSGFPI